MSRLFGALSGVEVILGNHTSMLDRTDIVQHPQYSVLRELHRCLERQTGILWRRTASVQQTLDAKDEIHACLKKFDSMAVTATVKHVFMKRSAPFYQGDQHRPDLLDVFEILPDTRVLVMVRDPRASAYSAFRRHFVDNIRHAALVCEEQLLFLNARLSMLPAHRYKVVQYEQFCEQPSETFEAILKFFGLDSLDFEKLLAEQNISRIQNGLWREALRDKDRNFLAGYFDCSRLPEFSHLQLTLD